MQKSLDKLAVLMPGRYAKNEISGGFVGSIDTYAYRMPIALRTGLDGQELLPRPQAGEPVESEEASAKTSTPDGDLW